MASSTSSVNENESGKRILSPVHEEEMEQQHEQHDNSSQRSQHSSSSSLSKSQRSAPSPLVRKQSTRKLSRKKRVPFVLVVPELRLAGLANVLLAPTRIAGVPRELCQGNALVRRLTDIFTFSSEKPAPSWLLRPLVEGLQNGGQAMDTLVAPPTGAQPMSLLTWLVQWKTLQRLFGWKGSDELVSMALAAGADPNIRVRNGSTAIFFAVKYGSYRTVQLLYNAGADLTVRDKMGRSCLWNALEYPEPRVIAFLLRQEHIKPDEAFPYYPKGKNTLAHQTAVDYLFASQLSLALDAANNPEYPWSWQILGVPSVENVARSMIMFGKHGVTFTPNDVTLSLLGLVMRGENPVDKAQQFANYEQARIRLETLAKLVVGLWLPKSIEKTIESSSLGLLDESEVSLDIAMLENSEKKQEMMTDSTDNSTVTQTCQLCKDVITNSPAATTLYCGHSFCAGCIMMHAKVSRFSGSCPSCQNMLCLELTGNMTRRNQCLERQFGRWGGPFGPQFLTVPQLRQECAARGISTRFRSTDKLRSLLDQHLISNRGNNTNNQQQVELNSNIPITNGSDINLISPTHGPVAVPITLKGGIFVLAYLSTKSSFSILAPEVVNYFGLKRSGLKSGKFRNLFGDEVDGEFHHIENFTFDLGSITITLNNALEAPETKNWIGIQLGEDFLQSGAWCVVDTICDTGMGSTSTAGTLASVDGFGHVSLRPPSHAPFKEELRYYSDTGESSTIPIFHLQPFKYGSVSNWMNVVKSPSFQECNWCTTVFPEGMLKCEDCFQTGKSVFYCFESCRSKAQPLHKGREEAEEE